MSTTPPGNTDDAIKRMEQMATERVDQLRSEVERAKKLKSTEPKGKLSWPKNEMDAVRNTKDE